MCSIFPCKMSCVGDIILKLSSQFFDDVQEAILVVEKLSFVHSFFNLRFEICIFKFCAIVQSILKLATSFHRYLLSCLLLSSFIK